MQLSSGRLSVASVVQWKGIRPWRPEYGQKESILFLDYFFILGDAVKLPDGWGGAHRPVWLVNEPKKMGAHGRARAAKTH